jgi:hypothetical protein
VEKPGSIIHLATTFIASDTVDVFEMDRKCLVIHACKVPPLLPASLFTPTPKTGEKSGHYITTIHFIRGALHHYAACGTDFSVITFHLKVLAVPFTCVWLVVSISSRSLIYE